MSGLYRKAPQEKDEGNKANACMSIEKIFREYKDMISMALMLIMICVFIVWAYDLGHYESLQYQKWYDDCMKIRGSMNFSEVFNEPSIKINISVK
jgi:hypothetical protein